MPVSKCSAASPRQPEARRNASHSSSLGDAAEHRTQVRLRISRGGARHQPIEDVHCRAGRCRACAPRLSEVGDEERLAARLRQRRRDLLDPAAVAVGLDDGGALGGRGARTQCAPVRGDCREIDGENTAGLRFGRPGRVVMPPSSAAAPPAINAARAAVRHRPDRRSGSRSLRSAAARCRSDHGAACR